MATGLKIANGFPGADIGAQINAAMAELYSEGSDGGFVVILPGQTTVRTQVLMLSKITLMISAGTLLDCSEFTPGTPAIVLRDGCSVTGAGRVHAKIKEAPRASNGVCVTIGDYVTWLEGGPPADGNSDLLVKGIGFMGNGLTGVLDVSANSGTVHFGNVHNAEVSDCYFVETHSFGVAMGGGPSLGFHADRLRITDNDFLGLWSQNIAVVNGNNFHIDRNTMTGTQQVAVTYIDVECNQGIDNARYFTCNNNVINILPGKNDETNTFFIQPGAAIQIAGGDAPPGDNITYYSAAAAHCTVAGNVIGGGIYPWNPPIVVEGITRYYAQGYLSQGISITCGQNINVSNNTLYLVKNAPIVINESRNCCVSDNTLINCGDTNSAAYGIYLTYSAGNVVRGNRISDIQGGYYSSIPSIIEIDQDPTGPFSHTDFNQICDNHLFRFPFNTDEAHGGTVGSGSYPGSDPTIVMCGKNSRRWNNYINGVAVDSLLIESLAMLRHIAPPGVVAATSSAPPVVIVGGRSTQGDGGFGVWWFDFTSTADDNDITVVKPDRLYPTDGPGRWLRGLPTIRLTTTERDALVLTSGDVDLEIFNITDGKQQRWDGAAWQDCQYGYTNIAALRAGAIPTGDAFVRVSGYATPDDKGGGEFYWDASSTETDNGGTIVKPTAVSGAGRWKRRCDPWHLDPRWFGAKGDYVTDDADAFEACLAAIPVVASDPLLSTTHLGGTIKVPGGNFTMSRAITIQKQVRIVGANNAGTGWIASNFNFPVDSAGFKLVTDGITAPSANGAVLENLGIYSRGVSDVANLFSRINCGTLAAGHFNTNLKSGRDYVYKGQTPNNIKVQLVGDSGGGVIIEETGVARIDGIDALCKIRYHSGVSTVGDVEDAIAADATLVQVDVSGTRATVLTAPTDNFAATNLSGAIVAHGVTVEAPGVEIRNCYVYGFGGNGIHIQADVTDPGGYSNANFWNVIRSQVYGVKGNGVYVFGHDVNVGCCEHVNVSIVGRWCFLDDSGISTKFDNCHAFRGGERDATCGGYLTSDASSATFVACYSESNAVPPTLGVASTWIGPSTSDGFPLGGANVLTPDGGTMVAGGQLDSTRPAVRLSKAGTTGGNLIQEEKLSAFSSPALMAYGRNGALGIGLYPSAGGVPGPTFGLGWSPRIDVYDDVDGAGMRFGCVSKPAGQLRAYYDGGVDYGDGRVTWEMWGVGAAFVNTFTMKNGRVGAGDRIAPTSVLDVKGAIATSYAAKNADYAVLETDSFLDLNAGSANVTATLPTAVGCPGRRYVFKRVDGSGHTAKVATVSAQTIDGVNSTATPYSLAAQNSTVVLVSDGANWRVESQIP